VKLSRLTNKRYAGRMAKDMKGSELQALLAEVLGQGAVIQRTSGYIVQGVTRYELSDDGRCLNACSRSIRFLRLWRQPELIARMMTYLYLVRPSDLRR
jgi:hypothetical protein